jgi:hypothetical protein
MSGPSPNQVPAPSAFVASQRERTAAGRVAALHGRVRFRGGRLVTTGDGEAPSTRAQSIPSPLPGVEPVQLRAQLRWLLTHDGHPAADGIQALLTTLLAQMEPRP